MRAVLVEDGKLLWGEAPQPELGEGAVRIGVQASAVNRADLLQARGGYPPPPGASPILGLECAGEVLEVGEGVSRVAPGDQVCALLAGGGYAEQVVVPAGQVLPVPKGLSALEAAALPEVFATAYLNLYLEGGLEPGGRALIHAGASGVGTAAVQLCRELGNPCFVTLGSRDKLERCLELGAEAGHVRHDGSFLEAVQSWAPEGVDVVLDPVGGAYLADNLNCLGLDGALVIIGLMGGMQTEVNLGLMLMKRLRVIGSTLRARSIAEKARIMDALAERVWPLIEAGRIKPIVEKVMPMAEAGAAHDLIASDVTFGKVLLELA